VLVRLTEVVLRRRWLVVVACAAAALLAALAGRGLFARLGYAVFSDPNAESTRAAALAHTQFGEGDPDVVALWHLPNGIARKKGFDDRSVHDALSRTLAKVAAEPDVARVISATGPGGDRFVSPDKRWSFAVISLRGTASERAAALPRLGVLLELPLREQVLPAQLGGLVPAAKSITRLAETSLARGERIALPVVAVLLVIIFGSVVAALLPLAMGGLSILLALGVLAILSRLTTVDAFAVNVVTILGLGVAIDYALFILSRYREELARNPDRRLALVRAAATAGRSVLFSGITVAASLSGLLVFPLPFLRSVAIGGMAVVLLASALALLVLPAVISLLGPRVEWGRVRRHGAIDRAAREHAFWQRVARAVIRRPLPVALAVTTILLLLAAPFVRLQPSRVDVRSLPAGEEARRVSEALAQHFPASSQTPIMVVVAMDGDVVDADRLGELYEYTERLRRIPGVTRVESLLSYAGAHNRDQAEDLVMLIDRNREKAAMILHGRYTLLRVISDAAPDSALARKQVVAVRGMAPPPGASVSLYGQAPRLRDSADTLRSRAPWMVAIICASMFVVLFLAFRSVVLPINAILMTALSLTASFGAIVFVFQDGRLQRLLHYEAIGTVDATLPVVMFAVIFGLSMDYEVLILGRIRETWLRTHDNRRAIVEGLGRTGRLVTSAALLMIVVFSAFAAAPVLFVKALGMGMALAVALDATVVRMLLVPSTMALLGRLNWWAPRRRVLRHFGKHTVPTH
jgi:RND superfamily putative drug exporter